MKFDDIPQFIHGGNYQCDVSWTHLENWIESHSHDGGGRCILDPDFQRGHVWDEYKQIAYVEYVLRGGTSSYSLYWNCKGWPSSPEPIYLVDGKQRMEAVIKFLHDELRIFSDLHAGGYVYSDFTDRLGFDVRFRMHVNNLPTRAEMLRWYCQLNAGGVVHTEEEIEKVRRLLAIELKKAPR